MKNLLTLIVFLSNILCAQTGEVAVQTVEAAKSNDWQSWAFGISALITAAAGVFVVSIHNGERTQSAAH